MNIISLEKMEEIVAKHKALSWDGWTVVESKLNPAGWSKKNGAFINGQWYIQNRIDATDTGWKISDKYA